jgi:adenylate cyclase
MSNEKELAIVFADVVGSTQLYESLGDDVARETVQRCVVLMKEATLAFGGKAIKTMGDEVMSTFSTADEAMQSACQMQQRIETGNLSGDEAVHVAIRIGCHFGQVTEEDHDIFGAAVHTANRMTSQAKAGQIITTESTVGLLGEEWQGLVRQIGVATLRGQSEEVSLFEVLWQPDEATSMLPKLDFGGDGQIQTEKLSLRFNGKVLELRPDGMQEVSLGRADDNDVTIKGNLISRIHARIEVKKNHFVLIDQSTNGTFVQRDDGEEIYVRRDSAQLTGSGLIGLGRVAVKDMPLAVEYHCEEVS